MVFRDEESKLMKPSRTRTNHALEALVKKHILKFRQATNPHQALHHMVQQGIPLVIVNRIVSHPDQCREGDKGVG